MAAYMGGSTTGLVIQPSGKLVWEGCCEGRLVYLRRASQSRPADQQMQALSRPYTLSSTPFDPQLCTLLSRQHQCKLDHSRSAWYSTKPRQFISTGPPQHLRLSVWQGKMGPLLKHSLGACTQPNNFSLSHLLVCGCSHGQADAPLACVLPRAGPALQLRLQLSLKLGGQLGRQLGRQLPIGLPRHLEIAAVGWGPLLRAGGDWGPKLRLLSALHRQAAA